jgi:SEC-C motif
MARVPPGFRPITHWDHVAHPQYYYVLARKLETEELAWFTPERLDELYARFCDAEAKGRGHRPRPFPDPADVARIAPKLPGRNDACWCGSAKKFKKCHGDARA